jgi:hypothetical protein
MDGMQRSAQVTGCDSPSVGNHGRSASFFGGTPSLPLVESRDVSHSSHMVKIAKKIRHTRKVAKIPARKVAKAPARKVAKIPATKVAKAPARKVAKIPARKVAKVSTGKFAVSASKVLARTKDGVYILKPRIKATHFTLRELRSAIASMRAAGKAQ